MECGKVRKNLNVYLEGLSSPKEKGEMEKHLEACRECRVELDELKKTIHLMSDLDEVEPPAWLTQKVMKRINAETALKESFLSRLFNRFPHGIPAAAVATLVVAVTAVILMKSMEPEIQETMRPSVPPSMEKRPLPPAQKSVPGPEETGVKKESSTTGKTEVGMPHADEDKGPAVAPRKQKDLREIPREDRVAAEGENRITAGSRGPGIAPPAPAAPAASSAQKPAEALPRHMTAKDETVADNAPIRAEQQRYAGKAAEKKAAGSIVQSYKQVITERHANGEPYIVVTYRVTSGLLNNIIMEERFDETGRRNGLHLAYDDSGKLKAEVRYEHGRVSSIKEYNPDGTLRAVESGQDWPWLQIKRQNSFK